MLLRRERKARDQGCVVQAVPFLGRSQSLRGPAPVACVGAWRVPLCRRGAVSMVAVVVGEIAGAGIARSDSRSAGVAPGVGLPGARGL